MGNKIASKFSLPRGRREQKVRKDSSPPPQKSGGSSVSPEKKYYITDLVIECKPGDAKNTALNAMGITVFSLGSENGNSLPLEKVSSTMWKHKSAIELPATIDTLMIMAQSKEGKDLGHVHLAGAELKKSTTSEASHNHVRREFTTESDGLVLTLSFQTCTIPSAGSTVEQDNQKILAAVMDPAAERDFALACMVPDDNPEKPFSMSVYGYLFRKRFRHTGSKDDIDNSILACEKAIQLMPRTDANFVNVLHEAGESLLERYAVTGSLSDINQAVSMFELIVDCTPEGHEDMPSRLTYLGNSLMRRFEHTGDLVEQGNQDKDENARGLKRYSALLGMITDDHPAMPDLLIKSGGLFLERFRHTRSKDDIDNSILAYQKAVYLTPISDVRYVNVLITFGSSVRERYAITGSLSDIDRAVLRDGGDALLERYEVTGSLSDVDQAVSMLEILGDATPEGRRDLPGQLANLGESLLRRFEHKADINHLSKAISVQQRAVHLTPNGHSNMPGRLNNLGVSLSHRFKNTGDITDIYKAISLQQEAVHLTPNNHPLMPQMLSNLGTSISSRFERTGDLSDIYEAISVKQKAVDLTADGRVDKPIMLRSLGDSFLRRSERTGDLSDISEAISVLQKAVHLTPNGHSDMPGLLSNLGNALRRRFEQTGDLTDISEAISIHQKAVHIIPDGDADMPTLLNNLGISFARRFERTGDLLDMSEAISIEQKAVQLTPNGHSAMPTRLCNLGNSFLRRFLRAGDLTDISKAISLQQEAVHLTPNGHPAMPRWLNNLGNSFLHRFRHTGDLTDISEAISVQQKAAHLTPDGHLAMPGLLSNLGSSFLSRFERTGDLKDISEAISFQQKAVHLTPNGHSNMPRLLNNLDSSFSARFERTGDLADIHTAISNCRLAATSLTASPSMRLESAQRWVKWSQIADPTQILDAYSVAIRLASQLAGLEQTIQRRHTNLMDIPDISTSAAAAAFYFGNNYGLALEWLEQGRCLVWNQLNNLRTPLDDLRACDPTLADHFSEVSKALENSGSRPESDNLGIEASMEHKMTLQAEADAHVKLAQKWDQLLAKIRNIPEFQNFLQPPKTAHLLKHLPAVGPVVVINVHKTRCDALALLSGTDAPRRIPLPDFSYKQADALRSSLNTYLTSHGVRSRGFELDTRGIRLHQRGSKGIRDILGELWSLVVKPILNGLTMHPTTDPSRIWWCATGPLAFLPIHAAGLYGQSDQGLGHCLSDFAISSYTPTISTLVERVRHPRKMDIASRKLLLISQPNTPGLSPIPGTTTEIRAVMTIMEKNKAEASHLEKDAATIARVSQEMATHSSIHLACHATQDTNTPLQSGFFLHDGRLELSEIIKRQTTNADLAFLSACQTSSGDEKLSEEAVHLAAGMLAAGYRGVVASMWSIMDCYGPEIAADFYENLLSNGIVGGEEGLNSAGAAHALHYAVQRIREKLGDSESALLAWVPYVHFGL